MRKSLLSLAVVSAISLSFMGCGSSDSTPSTVTDVTVERGPVYGAIVKDGVGNVAQQKAGANVYTFAQTPVYPITVTSGWIDVDYDGVMSQKDIALNIEMKSYSNIVTPVTTYIADSNATIRDEKLKALLAKVNSDGTDLITAEDLLKVASVAPAKAQMAINAVYAEMVQSGSANINSDDILSRVNEFQSMTLEPNISAKMRAEAYENYLVNSSDIATQLSNSKLSSNDILVYNTPVLNGSSIAKDSKSIVIINNVPSEAFTQIQSSLSTYEGLTIYRASKENTTCAADFVGFGSCNEADINDYVSSGYAGETVSIIGVYDIPNYVADTSTAGINDLVGKTFYTFTDDGEYSYYSKINMVSLVPLKDNGGDYSLVDGQWMLDTYEDDSVPVSSIEGNKLRIINTDTYDNTTYTNTVYVSIAEKTSTYWTMKMESSSDGHSDVAYEKFYLSPTPEILNPSLLSQTSSTARSVAKINKVKAKIFGLLVK